MNLGFASMKMTNQQLCLGKFCSYAFLFLQGKSWKSKKAKV